MQVTLFILKLKDGTQRVMTRPGRRNFTERRTITMNGVDVPFKLVRYSKPKRDVHKFIYEEQ